MEKKEVDFPFPFPAYPVQKQLMIAIHDTAKLGEGRVGIFGSFFRAYLFSSLFLSLLVTQSGPILLESPTGTGKSLSIITSALYWLTKTLVDTVCLLRSLSFCLALSCQPI
jgi:Rad3-related DNA helicase